MKKFIILSFMSALILFNHVPVYSELIDRGGGLIYDTDLNITWLQDANYSQTSGYDDDGRMIWDDAMAWANQLEYGGYDDWRLPDAHNQDGSGPVAGSSVTGSEMGHMFYIALSGTAGDSILNSSDPDLALFDNLQPYGYWSGTEVAENPLAAWFFYFHTGHQGGDTKARYEYHAWAVRDGDVEPNTYCVSTADELQNALIDAADNGQNDLIKVRQGTYNGNFVYSSTEAFSLTIEGGYNHRRCKKRVVDPENTVLDGQNSGQVLVLSKSGAAGDFFVDSLTLQNGEVTGVRGGGLYIHNHWGNVTLNNSIITNNHVFDYDGGGAYIFSAQTIVTISNNVFSNNDCTGEGGGFFADPSGTFDMFNNIIRNNSAQLGGGCFLNLPAIAPGNATITKNNINNNIADYGGGVYIDEADTATLKNNIFSDNTANYDGGGLHVYHPDVVTLTNNTISNNSATQNGGGAWFELWSDTAVADIYNNIILTNNATDGDDLYFDNNPDGDLFTNGIINLFNNDFDRTNGFFIKVDDNSVTYSNNLNNNPPLFVDPANGDYHLSESSPCIDAGTSVNAPNDDIDGESRPQGLGYDIGADEYIGTSETLDLDIARFTATKRVSVTGNKNTVEISLAVVNKGTVDDPCPASVVGMQDSIEVYNDTTDVSDAIGKGSTTFDFLPFIPTVDGGIVWTVTVDDDDPDVDAAVTDTTVNP